MKPMQPRKYAKGYKLSVSFRLPQELVEKLKKLAQERGASMSSFVQDGLDQWAEAHENADE